jgi:alkylation response protein AidB-like acyl-CoA dehydrogenase
LPDITASVNQDHPRSIKTSYSTAAGTAYVTFDGTKVPIGNMLGKENKGLAVILSNFNHER